VQLPPSAGALRARLHAVGAVQDERSLEDGSLELLLELPGAQLEGLQRQPGVRLIGEPERTPFTCEAGEAYLESDTARKSIAVR
jgi:hypothetical protein